MYLYMCNNMETVWWILKCHYAFQLEDVMETETYKNAKLILERFDPESKKKMVSFFLSYIYI